jgi:hypothetical protein
LFEGKVVEMGANFHDKLKVSVGIPRRSEGATEEGSKELSSLQCYTLGLSWDSISVV